jgi:hypothetical protein
VRVATSLRVSQTSRSVVIFTLLSRSRGLCRDAADALWSILRQFLGSVDGVTTDSTKKGWESDHASRIAASIRQLRGRQSAQWLSDETEKAGFRIPRTTISEIEGGKRKTVSTAELSVLAWALKVSPSRLLFPGQPDATVEIIPGVSVSSIDAVLWFSGEKSVSEIRAKASFEYSSADTTESRAANKLMVMARERNDLEQQVGSLMELIEDASVENPSAADSFTRQLAWVKSRIKVLNKELHEVGGVVVTEMET